MSEEATGGVVRREFRSGDPEEIHAHTAPRYGDNYRVIHGGGPYFYSEATFATGRVMIGRMARSFRQSLRAAVVHPTLFVHLGGVDSMRFGRRSGQTAGRGTAVICAPGQEFVRQGGPQGAAVALRVESELLERELSSRMRGRSRRWHVQSAMLHLAPERRSELLFLEKTLQAAARPGSSWAAFGTSTVFEEAAAAWMADVLLENSVVHSTTHASAQRLSYLQHWIDAHLTEDLSLGDLCRVARLDARPLQKAMMAAQGQSPLEFVASRRLSAALRKLQAAPAGTHVATIAMDCGFRHLGRFSVTYKRAFGESPSDTLKRRARGVDI